MRTVNILEDNDVIEINDYVRPLSFSGTPNSYSQYTGRPDNNTRWVKVLEVFGEWVIGITIGELYKSSEDAYHTENAIKRYEFIRGHIPETHMWNKPLRIVHDDD